MKSVHLLVSSLVLALLGCDNGDTSVSMRTPEVAATAQLRKVTHPKWGDIVWGRLVLTGTTRKLLSADINCFYLRIRASESEELWVDSHMDIQRGDYPAKDGKVSVAVYWPMKNFKAGTDADLAQATLEFKPWISGSCFEFAP